MIAIERVRTRCDVYLEAERYPAKAGDRYPVQPGWTLEVTWSAPGWAESWYWYGYRRRWIALAWGHARRVLGRPGKWLDNTQRKGI